MSRKNERRTFNQRVTVGFSKQILKVLKAPKVVQYAFRISFFLKISENRIKNVCTAAIVLDVLGELGQQLYL